MMWIELFCSCDLTCICRFSLRFLLPCAHLISKKYNHAAGPLVVERDSASGCLVNGNQRSGMVALSKAVDLAVDKARAPEGPRVAVVGTYNTCTSTGMLAYYAAKVASDVACSCCCLVLGAAAWCCVFY